MRRKTRARPERAAPFLLSAMRQRGTKGFSPPRIAGPSRRTGVAPPYTARLRCDGTAIWQPECHARLLEARLRQKVATTPVGSPHHGPTMRGSSTAGKNTRLVPRNRPSPRTRRSSAVRPKCMNAASWRMSGFPAVAKNLPKSNEILPRGYGKRIYSVFGRKAVRDKTTVLGA